MIRRLLRWFLAVTGAVITLAIVGPILQYMPHNTVLPAPRLADST